MQKKTHPWSQGWPFFVDTEGASYILEEHGLCFHLSANFLVALSGSMAVFLSAVTLNFTHILALWFSPGSKSNIYRNTGSFLREWSLCSESLLFTQKFIQTCFYWRWLEGFLLRLQFHQELISLNCLMDILNNSKGGSRKICINDLGVVSLQANILRVLFLDGHAPLSILRDLIF